MSTTPWLAFSIDKGASTPVFEQICEALRNRIHAGDLKEGQKLPPTRVFATELGLSRSTIVTAYDQLLAEGYISSRQGAAYRVCAVSDIEFPKNHRPQSPPPKPQEAPKPRIFAASLPDMRLFPHRQWARAVARVCRTNPQSMLVGPTRFGNPALRAAIANHVYEWRGIEAHPDQIIVTAGAIDALEICLRSLARTDRPVGIESPGYPPMRRFVENYGFASQFLEVTEDGAEVPDQGTPPGLVMLTPSHQFPLGGAMPPNRRIAFIQWARENDSWIIEDDYDSEFRYSGRPIPAMAGFDQLNRTIYVGSFSKIFSNSLRLGYLVVPDGLRDRMAQTIDTYGVKASYMPQQALAEFIESGEFYRHLRRVRRIYGDRRAYLIQRLSAEFSDYGSFRDHQAGMQIAFHLKPALPDVEIAERASQMGLHLQPLSKLSNTPTRHNGLLLGYCGFNEEELSDGFEVLHTCLKLFSP